MPVQTSYWPASTLRMAGAGLFLATVSAASTASGLNEPVTFTGKHHDAVGAVTHFKAAISFDGRGPHGRFSFAVSFQARQKVTSVDAAGEGTLAATAASASVVTVGPEGRLLRRWFPKDLNPKSLLKMINAAGDNQSTDVPTVLDDEPPAPPRPVRIGDSWTCQTENLVRRLQKITMSYTLESAKVLHGVETLKITGHGSFRSEDGDPIVRSYNVSSVYIVDRKTGDTLHMHVLVEFHGVYLKPGARLLRFEMTDDISPAGAVAHHSGQAHK